MKIARVFRCTVHADDECVRFTFIAQQHVVLETAWWLENRDQVASEPTLQDAQSSSFTASPPSVIYAKLPLP